LRSAYDEVCDSITVNIGGSDCKPEAITVTGSENRRICSSGLSFSGINYRRKIPSAEDDVNNAGLVNTSSDDEFSIGGRDG
jgi:hypothetical protein